MPINKHSQKNPSLKLRVLKEEGQDLVYMFNDYPISFGRSADCTVKLEDSSISRHHAEIYSSGGVLYLKDCRSLNGIRINGELVLEVALEQGAEISIGDVRIMVQDIYGSNETADEEKEISVRPEATGGVLEVIRAIDLQEVLNNGMSLEDGGPLLITGSEEAREHHRKLSRAYNNLMLIMDFVSTVGSFSHVHQLCEQFVSVLRRVFSNVESVIILGLEGGNLEDPKTLYSDSTFDFEHAETAHPSRTVLDRVLREMRAVYAVDARKDARFTVADSVRVRGVRSMMCTPLVARGEVIGAIYVDNVSSPYCFSHFDLNLLTVFSFHLAVSLEISRLLEQRDKAFEHAASSLKAAKKDKVALLLQYSQSEKKFRALFEQSALGAMVIDLADRKVAEVNDGLVRMLGYGKRKLTQMSYGEFFDGVSPAEIEDWLTHVRQNAQASWKTVLRTASDDLLVTLQSCRILRVGDNEMMVANFIDITAKERAEEETLKQLQRVTALSELSQGLLTALTTEQEIFELFLSKAAEVLPVDDFQVAVLDEGETQLRIAVSAYRGRNDRFVFDKAEKIVGENNQVKKVLMDKKHLLHKSDKTQSFEAGSRSPFGYPKPNLAPTAIYMPVISRDELRGILVVQSNTHDAYTESHIETLRAMVAQTAMALSNSLAFEALREKEESLRQLSGQILNAQETERGRISRELHDGIGQQLTAMKYLLESMRKTAQSGTKEKLLDSIGEARELATQTIQDLRNISLDLRPTMLDDFGLITTLEWFVRQFQNRCGIVVELESPQDFPYLEQETSSAIYRIVQEALGNIAKHSQATYVMISLLNIRNSLSVEVRDNGVGFDLTGLHSKQSSQGCSGVLNMKERGRLLGGQFHLETEPGKGTTIFLTIPL